MPAIQRVAAIAVALLVVAGVAALFFRGETTLAPIASTEATASGEPTDAPVASASASPGPSTPVGEAQVLETLSQIEEQVIEIRGLEAAEIGPPDLITRDELAAELQRLFDEDYPPEERERDNVSLRALGLLEPGQDVAELQLELLGDQVLGFYDDVEQRMVVVTDAGLDAGLDAEAKLTYAHEYTHALQDAAFGLDSLETDAVGEDDRGLARTALIEGDATVAMLAWAFEHLSPEELVSLGQTPIPDTSGIPAWMVATLQFPYTAGQVWATTLAGDPLSPNFREIDAAYADPPTSTEQIIHIEAWTDREQPVPVETPDLATELGEGWEEVDATPIGEASIGIMLEYFGVPHLDATAAGAGWGGDRVVIATGPDDAFALAWRLAWDTPADATEFADAYRGIVDELGFPAVVIELDDDEVLVAHASSEEILRSTVDAAGG